MLVGNDVVDLHDPGSRPDAIHPRFDQRAFTQAERASIVASGAAHRIRWSVWAAKESAFKVASKLDRGTRFLPREFAVRMISDARAEVNHRVGRIGVWLDQAEEWLHAVAAPLTRVAGVDVLGPRDGVADHRPRGTHARLARVRTEDSASESDGPSLEVRELARKGIGSFLRICPGEIELASDGGIPVLCRRQRRLPVDVSLSHHGRFVACAWALHGL